MMNFMPMTLYSLSTMLLLSFMTLMMMNKMMSMKWEICSIMNPMIAMDIMMEWSSMMYPLIIMLISGSVMKFSKNM